MDTFKRNATSLATGGATTQPAQLTTSLTSAQLPTPAVKNTNGGGILYAGAAVGNTDPPAPNSNTLDKESQNCFCFESDDDSAERIRIKNTKKRIARNCVGNIAISILLIFYTLIGAIIFLIVEGGSGMNVRRSESRTKVNSPDNLQLSNNNSNGYLAMSTRNMNSSVNNHTAELLSVIGDGPRTHTVENIWDITVSLNILYRENWTRLAGQELNSFQEMIVQRILEEMHSPGGSTAAAIQGGAEQRAGDQNIIEWNLAKSFLYALTVLTTIAAKLKLVFGYSFRARNKDGG
ncbi:hypothetical protein LSTR_LSTR010762 [Laodelphax striatellus]|uniref:Uncharacterized protein n=1 Tax=Laodelphax striatellus TaxID=195883 RepID=A0A482XGC5_LAOST|nr:hypothetical protein LSTR_LSTR010762 [Laodelphax striatellus]